MTTKLDYKNTSLNIDDRVSHLLSLMTIEEKVAQLHGVWVSDLIDMATRQFMIDKAQRAIPHGTGHVTRIGAVSLLPPKQTAELANSIQHYLVNETRLGLPGIVHEESCAGYLAKDATSFPQAIGLAATWEPELIHEMAGVIRKQMRAVGAHHSLAPVLDVVRDPRWGRVEETFGEDPFLVTALGIAYIEGLQTQDWTQGILATAKHFIGYGLPEGGLNWAPSHIPQRLLREVFLPPFAAAVKTANVASVMNGYQEIDGIPCGSSQELLVDLLRGELGFDGTILSDYFTISMFVEYHHITNDKGEAAKYALEAGIDVELPDSDCYGQPLLDAIEAGEIGVDLVDACVSRIIRQKIQLGLLEYPYVDTEPIAEIYNQPEAIDLSRMLAAKSVVLLKNQSGVLPLSRSLKRIAVIGPSADRARLMQGDYHYPAHLEGIINHDENMDAPSPGSDEDPIDWEAHRPPTTTVLQGIRNIAGSDIEVVYEEGCAVTGSDKSGFTTAVDLAQRSDVAILAVGDISGLGLGSTSGEAIDRATLELPGVQQELILAVAETGTPTVVVALSGRPPVLTDLVDHVDALLMGWLPAQEGGQAIAEILFGDVNPGGKLPLSLPRHVGQVPVYYNHKPSGARSHWHGDYADMSTKPLFPFGFGQSYTTFEYRNLSIKQSTATAQDTVEIQFEIQNTGTLAGEEVVQLYVSDPVASVTRPVKQLKGFKRIELNAGEAKNVIIELNMAHLAFYDRHMNYVVEPGVICIMVGSSSEDIRLSAEIEIVGTVQGVEQVFTTQIKVLNKS